MILENLVLKPDKPYPREEVHKLSVVFDDQKKFQKKI